MELYEEIARMLRALQPHTSHLSESAYDTAWIARLHRLSPSIGEPALEWLRRHQLSDGSWGEENYCYHHDRLISTLNALIALVGAGDTTDHPRIEQGCRVLAQEFGRLKEDPCGETIGFEIIVPTLIAESHAFRALRPIQDYASETLSRLAPKRAKKLGALPHRMINRQVPLSYSAEMAGVDGLHLLDIDNLQENNGSVAQNPSATAYFALYARPGDAAALGYLDEVTRTTPERGVPGIYPTDIFEIAWVLYNLTLGAPLEPGLAELYRAHLDFLKKTWTPGSGISYVASEYGPLDGDDTAMVYTVLTRLGYPVDIEGVLSFEMPEYFRCLPLESNASISANVHVLEALRTANYPATHPTVQKVLRFLAGARQGRPFWFDKWHASPYYTTSHAIIACAGYQDDQVADAVQWLLKTQHANGAWGHHMATAEETAYALQALVMWKLAGGAVSSESLQRGASWLVHHCRPPYPALWLNKSLYCPIYVVESAVLGALRMVAFVNSEQPGYDKHAVFSHSGSELGLAD